MYIAVYVDDLLIVVPSIAEIKKIKRSLRNRFQMTNLGPCSYYLEISIQRDRQNRKHTLTRLLINLIFATSHRYADRNLTASREQSRLYVSSRSEDLLPTHGRISDVPYAWDHGGHRVRSLCGE